MPHAMTCDKCDVSERKADLSTMISVYGNLILVCPSCRAAENRKKGAALSASPTSNQQDGDAS